MRTVLADARDGLLARRGRTGLAAAGVFAASLVLGVVVCAAYALTTGFDRAAERADLPSVIARFSDEDPATVDERVRALPNLAARAYRAEFTRVPLAAGGRRLDEGVVQVVDGPRRGYAIVAGHDVGGRGDEAVVEAGLAREWSIEPGDRLDVGRLGPVRVAGVALSPDNVSYPLVRTARIYLSRSGLRRRFGSGGLPVNVALLWAREETRTDVLLSQARASAGGLEGLRFTTRSGVRTLVEQGASLVIGLLVAFAAVAVGLSGLLLAAGARSDVQRRLPSIGVRRALGATPGAIVGLHAAEGAMVAAPAGAAGLALGAALAAGPVGGVLDALNELAPGPIGYLLVLAVVWAAVVALVAATAAWPAWRAARGAPAGLIRRGDLHRQRAASGRSGGLARLGARLVTARRGRYAAVVAVLGAASAVVLLLLSLASLLSALRDDPATLGKRYQLSADAPPERARAIAALPGVSDAAPRLELSAVSATALGTPLRLIAFPDDHTRFEAPPLAAGRRLAGAAEAEVGAGLADAVGLRVGSTLSVQPGGARELRFRVVGIVRALQDEGRVAYVRPRRVAAALPFAAAPIAIRLEQGADRAAVRRALAGLGVRPRSVGGATGDDRGLLRVLAGLLRVVSLTVVLVCLASLVQALALTAAERRGAIATLRAAGADARALRRLLAGAAVAVVAPAALLALALEWWVLAPAVERLAAGYADLPLRTGAGQVVLVALALVALTAAASAATARRLLAEPVVAGLRESET